MGEKPCPLIIGEGGQAVENGVVVRVERTHAEQRGREWEEPVGLAACAILHKPRHLHAKQGFLSAFLAALILSLCCRFLWRRVTPRSGEGPTPEGRL